MEWYIGVCGKSGFYCTMTCETRHENLNRRKWQHKKEHRKVSVRIQKIIWQKLNVRRDRFCKCVELEGPAQYTYSAHTPNEAPKLYTTQYLEYSRT